MMVGTEIAKSTSALVGNFSDKASTGELNEVRAELQTAVDAVKGVQDDLDDTVEDLGAIAGQQQQLRNTTSDCISDIVAKMGHAELGSCPAEPGAEALCDPTPAPAGGTVIGTGAPLNLAACEFPEWDCIIPPGN